MQKSSFTIVLGCILIGYGILNAIFMGAFEGVFIWAHIIAGLVFLLIWFLKGGLVMIKSNINSAKKSFGRFFHIAFDVACILCILICINYIANRYDKRIDTTEAGVYSLSQDSLNVLDKLRYPVHFTVLTNINNPAEKEELENLLSLYRYNKRNLISFEMIDPRRNPHRVQELEFKQGENIAVEYMYPKAKRFARLSGADESTITNALAKLINGERGNIYYVVGHGEPSIESTTIGGTKKLADALRDIGFNIKTFFLKDRLDIPEDAEAVIWISPKKDVTTEEILVLKRYLDAGGGLFLMSDPDGSDGVQRLAADYGIEIGKNVILDVKQSLQGGPEVGSEITIREYVKNSITESFESGDITAYSSASTVMLMSRDKLRPGAVYTEFIKTSSSSAWAETNLDQLFGEPPMAALGENDRLPPFALGVTYENKQTQNSKRNARMVVIGDSNWILNVNINIFANRKLFLNSVNWITHENNAITVPARSLRESNILLSERMLDRLKIFGLILPEIILLLGMAICWHRKRQ